MNKTFVVYNQLPPFPIWQLKQTHSNLINLSGESNKEADGLISDLDFKIIPAIKTADCLPIVIMGKEKLAFIHAGWKGLYNKILYHQYIKTINPIYAFIGPHISSENFEVQKDFSNYFPSQNHYLKLGTKTCFNLENEAIFQLKDQFSDIQIEKSGVCTFNNLEFNSYRRDKLNKRNYNLITNQI